MSYAKMFVVLLVVLFTTQGLSQSNEPKHAPVGLDEKLGDTVPLDLEFYDEGGYPVTLRELINKPTIVTFVYYQCPGLCSPLLTEVSRMVDAVDLELGKDYEIVTVSFNKDETPDIAAMKKENYIASLEKAVDEDAWHFLTGDSSAIMAFTGAAGFYFKREGKDFVHPTALVFLSPEGKITRYLNGIQYLPFNVKMALIEASEGKVSPTIAKLLNFCFSFDPESHSYALNITRVAGGSVLLLVVLFVVIFIVKPKKKKEAK